MSKPRTFAQVQDRLDRDWGWRIVEISALKKNLRQGSGARQDAATRALIALTYAHWEGFIKSSAVLYAEHISLQGITYGQALACLSGYPALEYSQSMEGIRRKLFTASRLLMALKGLDLDPVKLNLAPRLDRIGNLNYELFSEVSEFFGFDMPKYETKKQFIDESLLRRRNKIAHGEFLDLDNIEAGAIADDTIAIMSMFKEDISIGASNKTYRRVV